MVARMLIELLDRDCIKAVAEALAGLRTEEAIQAVVQVSLTLASADRPDIVADVSAPSLPVSLSLFVCTNLTLLTEHWRKRHKNQIALLQRWRLALSRSPSIRQRLCCLLPKEVRRLQSKALDSGGNVVQLEAVLPEVQSRQSSAVPLQGRVLWCRSRLRWRSMGVWTG